MAESIRLKDDVYLDTEGLYDNIQEKVQQVLNKEILEALAARALLTEAGYSLAVSGKTVSLKNKAGTVLSSITTQDTWRGIQNNLTSTSTTDSLSAYQGKVLNDGKLARSGLYGMFMIREYSKSYTIGGNGAIAQIISWTNPSGYTPICPCGVISGHGNFVVEEFYFNSIGSNSVVLTMYNTHSGTLTATCKVKILFCKTS